MKKTLKKLCATTAMAATVMMAAGVVMTSSEAHALGNKSSISMVDVNRFVLNMNADLETPNSNIGLHFLERAIAPTASFDNRYTNYTTSHHYRNVYYSHRGYAYRYPTAYYSPQTSVNYSYNRLGKSTFINDFLKKKASWAGYKPVFKVLRTDMDASRKQAYVKVKLDEYALTYNAAAPRWYGEQRYSDATCDMTLEKTHGEVQITNMSCNYARHFAL